MFNDTARDKMNNTLEVGVLPEKSRTTGAFITILLILVGISGSLYLTDGNFKITAAILVPILVLGLTIYRLDYSFFLLLGCTLFFDQFLVPEFKPFTYYVDFFRNFKEISYLPTHPAGVINPIELYFMLLGGTWFLMLAACKKITLQSIPVWPAFLLFFSWLLFAFLNGLRSGGQIVIAFWEVRALFYFSILYLVVPQIIQTKKQIRTLIWISILAIFFKACQGITRFAAAGFSTEVVQTFTNHEDPVFMSTLFIFLAVMLLLKYRDRQRTVLLLLTLPLLLGFYVSLRRAAYAGLFISLLALFVLLDREERMHYLKLAVPALAILFAYGATFWNSDRSLAKPVQMVKSGLFEPDKEKNPGDYYSNLYRDYENYNLASTVQRKPITGIGFGNKYDKPVELVNISFPLRDYIPHNQILWWMVKTGAIGFFGFWIFFNAFVYKGASVYAKISDPYLKAVCAMAVIAVINQMAVSFFDLQLTYYRSMIYLGTLMGLLPTIERLGTKDTNAG